MRTMNAWTVLASLFCTLTLSDAAYQAQQQARLAAVGNPAAVSRLSDVVSRMSGSEAVTAPAPAAKPVLVNLRQDAPYQRDFQLLVDWASKDGRQGKIWANTAKLIGLNEGADVPSLAELYRNPDTKTIYGLNLIDTPSGVRIVLNRTTPQLSAIWLLTTDGQIIRAAEITASGRGIVPAHKYDELLLETKDLLLGVRAEAVGIADAGRKS